MRKSTILLILSFTLFFLSAAIGFTQPSFTIDNKKDACNSTANGSFDINLTASNGSTSAFIFSGGPPIGPIALSVGLNPITGLLGTAGGRSYLVVVSDDDGSTNKNTTIFLVSNVSASVGSTQNITTCSPPNGQINLTVSGGSGSYTYSWTGPGGFTSNAGPNLINLASGNYSVTVGDANTNCSQSLGPITLTIASPSVTFGSIPGVCSGTTTSSLSYSNPSSGSPDRYRIDWDLAAESAGLMDVTSTILTAPPGSLPINNIPLAAGTYNALVFVKNNATGCESAGTAISVTVTANVTPSVSISSSPVSPICSGTSVTFTASPTNGGATPGYQWKKNGSNVGVSSVTYTDAGLVNGDVITVVMTSSLTCVTTPTATSAGITMTVTTPVTPSVSISSSPVSPICSGTSVTFTASPTNGGATPSYQWKKNGSNVGVSSVTYTDAGLVNGDVITVVMTSSLTCVTTPTATSAGITMTVTTPVTPSVSISSSPVSPICSGTSVTFTASPTNGGATPSYQWKKNGSNVGVSSVTYTDAGLVNGDVITVVMTSSLTCVTTPTATSTGITMTVNPTPSVTFGSIPGVCSGTTTSLLSYSTPSSGSPDRYRIDWDLAAESAGLTDVTSTILTAPPGSLPINNIPLAAGTYNALVFVKNNATGCESAGTAISVTVTANVTPSVSISSSPVSPICSGTSVTFTASPTNGGATPGYQWKKNGSNVGVSSVTYTDAGLVNGDVITVVMTSSLTCVTTPTATSAGITMTVTTPVTPSVSISSSPVSPICSGTSVTFTASPTNGGATPSYQWKKNGSNVGVSSVTYTDAGLVNGDVITVVMTSSLTCVTTPTATSAGITMTVTTPVTPSVSISSSPVSPICSGTSVTFTASPTNGGATPSYQWKKNGSNVGVSSVTYTDAGLVNGDVITVVMTSSLTCVTTPTATSAGITMTVTTPVTPSVSISSSPVSPICSGTSVTFTASPTNGGATPSYQWKKNGSNVGVSSVTYTDAGLVNGDVITVVMTSSLTCVTTPTATSTGITMTVTTPVTPSVSISSSPVSPICSGTSVTFTASPTNGGATPSYQWKKNGSNVGVSSVTYTDAGLVNGDVITVVMTSSLTCVTTPTATSAGITMTVTTPVTPSVSISSSPVSPICSGTSVTFTASPTNGGATPSYQWKKNGSNVGVSSVTYTDAGLVNGDVITVVMTSSLICVTTPTATSAGITMTVTTPVTPSVSISSSPVSPICSGTSVTFTASPTNGGATPGYQWKKNGSNVGVSSVTYTDAGLVNGDVITVVMTSSLTCVTTPTATSAGITMTVTTPVTPSVSISSSPVSPICSGTSVTFTASPTNGGATPSYQWKKNGSNVGVSSVTYTDAGLVNGDVITVVMTSSLTCVTTPTATSAGITMTVTTPVTPSVSISSSPVSPICSGTSVTFTASPTNGGATPSYQWKKNGSNVGVSSVTYTDAGLVNGDVITVVMTSSLTCVTTPTATSAGITMTVTTPVTPSVSISSSPVSPICSGTSVTFTASPTNGGATPSYQWKKNGSNVGVSSVTYTDAGLVNGDVITVVMTSSLTCVTTPTATSTGITMTINPTPSTSLISGTTPVCANSVGVAYSVTNTAGSTYAWTITGGVQSGGNTNHNITVDWGATAGPANVSVVETNSLGCSGSPVNLAVTINPQPTATLTGTTTICAGSNTNLTVKFTGNAPWIFTYSDGTTTSASINSNFNTFTIPVSPATTTTYSLVSVLDANCTGTIAGSSAVVTVDNPPIATLSVSAAVSPLCNGGSTTIDVANSEVGVSYQLRNGVTVIGSAVNGTGATINLSTGALAVTTTFNVLATRGVCTPVQLNNTATVTVAGNINAGLTVIPQLNPICSGSATNIQVAASEIGVNYQLRDGSNTNIGPSVAGTGGSINLPTGNLSATQTFNILASNVTCSVQLTSTPTVNVDVNPNPALTVAASINPLCSGGSTTVTVAASEVGVSYQLRDATNALIGGAVAGNGATISLPTGNLASTTTFNVLATGGAACPSVQLTSTVTITVAGSIDPTLVVLAQNSPICSGTSTNIQIASSEVGVDYQLRDNSNNALIGSIVTGTGLTIDLPTGNLAATKTFNVLASNGTCSTQLNSVVSVNVDVNPNSGLATSTPTPTVCLGGSSSISVANSELGVSYQLRDASNANIGSAVLGTGASINLSTGALASSTTFNVLATSGVCASVQLTATVSITVGGSLNTGLTITPQSASICSGTATNIQIANSEIGVTYQLRDNSNNSLIGSVVNGNGITINLATGNLAANTTFNILASNGTCSTIMSTLPSVTVNTQPNAALGLAAQNSAVCTGTGTNIQVSNSELGVSYQLRNNSGNALVGASVNGTGGTINLATGNLIASTTFNVLATGGGSCSAQLSTTATVSVLLATDPLCTGGGGTGTCATVVITPVPTAATCTLSNGAINFNINPATPVVNNTGVKITVTGISTTNSTIARTNFNDPSFPALPTGVYNYVIEYGDPSCTKNGQVTIDQSGTVGTPVASNIVAPVCAGTSTGSLQLDVAGETGNLLQWSLDGITFTNFTAGNVITGIPAGAAPSFQRVISVRRNSSDPCFASVTVTIQDANPAITTTLTPTSATCSNNDGSILVGPVSGGVGPYTYLLDGVAIALPANNTFTGLKGGNYMVSVLDSKGCQTDFNTTVNFPGLVNYFTSITNPSCLANGNDGVILLTILSSGTFQVGITTDPNNPPTTIQNVVSSGNTIVTFGALTNGGYYISMTPVGAACFTKSTKLDLIGGPTAVDFTLASTNILCFENKGGVALSDIKGSNLVDYSYEIIDGNGNVIPSATVTPSNPINQLQALGTVTLTGLDKGDYKIRLFQDQSISTGCAVPITSSYKSFTIAGPVAPLDTLFVTRKISLPDLPTGSMLIGIKESQQEPYDIQLELKTPFISGQAFILNPHGVPARNPQNLIMEYEAKNLFAGIYELKITDALGCQKTFSNIEIKVDTDIFIPNVFTPNGDNTNDNFYIRNLPDGTQVTISNRWGAEVFTSSSYKNDWTGGNNPDGIYFYRIGVSGKVFTGWVEIIRGQ